MARLEVDPSRGDPGVPEQHAQANRGAPEAGVQEHLKQHSHQQGSQ